MSDFDGDVKRGPGRPVDPRTKEYLDAFRPMKPGRDSLFVKGARMQDVAFLRKPFERAGLGAQFKYVPFDKTHKTSGVRITRMAGRSDDI